MTDPSQAPDELDRFLPYRLSVLLQPAQCMPPHQLLRNALPSASVTEWRVIAVLGRFPGLSANEVAERTAMDKVAVSRAVAEADGIRKRLQREPRTTTTAGARCWNCPRPVTPSTTPIVPLALTYERALLDALEPQERQTLIALLDKLGANAKQAESVL
jgi:hypothetical protein